MAASTLNKVSLVSSVALAVSCARQGIPTAATSSVNKQARIEPSTNLLRLSRWEYLASLRAVAQRGQTASGDGYWGWEITTPCHCPAPVLCACTSPLISKFDGGGVRGRASERGHARGAVAGGWWPTQRGFRCVGPFAA